jgi:hypothetical protein
MVRQTAVAVCVLVLWTMANAQGISLEELTGVWNYESYAEVDTPDAKIPVGAQMDFRADGTVIMTLSSGKAEGTFVLEGNTIHYTDSNGSQVWNVRSYDPGKTLILEYKRALMFFVKPGTD